MWLGIDVGTSGVKIVVIDDQSNVIAQKNESLSIERPHDGWSEQHPASWWSAVQSAVSSLPKLTREAITGIGLSGQMHGAVLLDKQGHVLRPAILWNDGRSAKECAELELVKLDSRSITGNIAMPGFTAPKLMWVRNHEPEIFAKTAKVLLPKDYVRLCMTGDYASDMSDSAGTLWLDVANRRWSESMLEATGLSVEHMPKLFEGSEITGQLSSRAANELGLRRVPVVAGGGDNAAGAAGAGVINEGNGFLSLGTSGVIFTVSKGYAPSPNRGVHAFCHALPDRWHQMAVILSAASAVDWAVKLTGFSSIEEAFTAVESHNENGPTPIFLPYLSGERTPHNDPYARGVLSGLDHSMDRTAVLRAVLEGVAFALADGLEALRSTGTKVNALTVIGGGSRSKFWGHILANALNCRLDYCKGGDIGPALGAAKLAHLGIVRQDIKAVCKALPTDYSIEPETELPLPFLHRREQFRSVYRSLSANTIVSQQANN